MVFPGPRSAEMLDEMRKYVVFEPYPFALDLERCEGMYLATVDGQRLFDWAGYYGSKLIGHNHPGLFEPDYLRRLSIAANNKTANPDFLTPECLNFYRFLVDHAPACMRGLSLEVYAVNSGAEAVENMMKYMISRFNSNRAKEGKTPRNARFIYFEKAFHGRTVFALGVTQTIDEVATKDFQGLAGTGNIKLPFPSVGSKHTPEEKRRITEDALRMVEAVASQMAEEIVGIVVEPIQGAGGQRCAEPEFFRGLSEICHRHGILLGFDEVQTAGGTLGTMFAIDQFDLPHPPIAVATGKKFGTGVVYMLEPLEEVGVLDSTWGGTLADMVRVLQEFEIVRREGLIKKAITKGARLRDGLLQLAEDFPNLVQNIRGIGLYQGFQFRTPALKAQYVQKALEEHQMLVLGAGYLSIRTRPNLSVTEEDIDRFIDITRQICRTL